MDALPPLLGTEVKRKSGAKRFHQLRHLCGIRTVEVKRRRVQPDYAVTFSDLPELLRSYVRTLGIEVKPEDITPERPTWLAVVLSHNATRIWYSLPEEKRAAHGALTKARSECNDTVQGSSADQGVCLLL